MHFLKICHIILLYFVFIMGKMFTRLFSVGGFESTPFVDKHSFVTHRHLYVRERRDKAIMKLTPGSRINIKTISWGIGIFHYKDKTVRRASYRYNGDSCARKASYLYWDGPLAVGWKYSEIVLHMLHKLSAIEYHNIMVQYNIMLHTSSL